MSANPYYFLMTDISILLRTCPLMLPLLLPDQPTF